MIVSGEKSPQTPFTVGSPTTDLDGNTQDIINPKRSSSPEIEGVLSVNGRKKKIPPKMKKDKN